MTKRVKYTAICKEWKLINFHLLRPRSTCKFEFLMPTFPQLFGMSFMIIQIIYKLNPTPFALRVKEFAASDILEALEEYFLETLLG